MRVRASRSDRLAFFLPSLEGGGAERVMINLASGFADRGFATDLVLARANGCFLGDVPTSVRVVDLNASRLLASILPLARYLRRERPAALLAALNHANLVAMAVTRVPGVRTRCVISIHNTLSHEIRVSNRKRIIAALLGRVHRWADAIIAVSEGVASDFASVTAVPRDRVIVIYNPVVTPALLEAASKSPTHKWFADTRQPVVLGVGRLTPQKNFQGLIRAFARVKDRCNARLIILGEGSERPALERLIREHGVRDRVSLPGFVENPHACMARAAVFVLSSRWEGLPTVLIEALALGTSIVSTDCASGPREILQDGALGTLVPVGDDEALAGAIVRAVHTPRPAPPPDAVRPYMPDVVLDQYQAVLGAHA